MWKADWGMRNEEEGSWKGGRLKDQSSRQMALGVGFKWQGKRWAESKGHGEVGVK